MHRKKYNICESIINGSYSIQKKQYVTSHNSIWMSSLYIEVLLSENIGILSKSISSGSLKTEARNPVFPTSASPRHMMLIKSRF
eukprot:UN03007